MGDALPADTAPPQPTEPVGRSADRISDARERARALFAGEAFSSEIGGGGRWLLAARDGVALAWLVWVALLGLGEPQRAGGVMIAVGLGAALYFGTSTSVAARSRLDELDAALEREREEIRNHPEREREEVRALYAAKGIPEPLLTQVTDALCADEDRLLKVMMEGELGLFTQHVHHPLLAGIWRGSGTAFGVITIALPAWLLPPETARVWIPSATAAVLIALAVVNGRLSRRGFVPQVFRWLALVAVAGGATLYLSDIISSRV